MSAPASATSTSPSPSAAIIRSAETYWLDRPASIDTRPAGTSPLPRTVTGGQPVGASTSMPRAASASTKGRIGRLRMWASPSTTTVPIDGGDRGGEEARGGAGVAEEERRPGRPEAAVAGDDETVSPGSSTAPPWRRRASAISRVSSLFSAPVRRLVPRARPASNSARLVMLFDPGGDTRPRRGPVGGTIVTAGLRRSKLMVGSPGEMASPVSLVERGWR